MGKTCYCVNFFSSMEPADWIALFGVIINAILAYWIVRTIQTKLTNKRVLKDHFINEIKEIRNDYKVGLDNFHSNSTEAHSIIPWFKNMNIKVSGVMGIINTKYDIDTEKLRPFQIKLRELITNNEDFIAQYGENQKIVFSQKSKRQLFKFQQSYNQLFNEIIIEINDVT